MVGKKARLINVNMEDKQKEWIIYLKQSIFKLLRDNIKRSQDYFIIANIISPFLLGFWDKIINKDLKEGIKLKT